MFSFLVKTAFLRTTLISAIVAVLISQVALSQGSAFKISEKTTSVSDLYESNQGQFFDLEKQKYELIEKLAREKYLEHFWGQEAKKNGHKDSAKAREEYLKLNARVTAKEISSAKVRFKDHPRLKELSDSERSAQITDYLKSVKTRETIERILDNALKSKELVVLYPKPNEPLFKVIVNDDDPVKYGPKPRDTKPMGCAGEACPITVVEFSEFQCPFCERVLPAVRQLLNDYKGKVRWIVRDFPLGFHKRARPAAVAARCAKQQGKYWEMYEELFKNQRSLEDEDLKKYAKNVGLNLDKFLKCFGNPEDQLKVIEKNFRSGEELGVTGTPAFFINGRRIAGALPYDEFKRIFEEELQNLGKK